MFFSHFTFLEFSNFFRIVQFFSNFYSCVDFATSFQFHVFLDKAHRQETKSCANKSLHRAWFWQKLSAIFTQNGAEKICKTYNHNSAIFLWRRNWRKILTFFDAKWRTSSIFQYYKKNAKKSSKIENQEKRENANKSTPNLSSTFTAAVLASTSNVTSALRSQFNKQKKEIYAKEELLQKRKQLQNEMRQIEMRENHPAWLKLKGGHL